MTKLIPISENEFKGKVKIRFCNINNGFAEYNNKILQGSEEDYIKFFEQLFELNGEDNSYIDFYYNNLNEEQKSNMKSLISKEDNETLIKIESTIEREGIYYRLTLEVIPFMVRLCTREVLFSTFYFTKYLCTIWGNYNNKFPLFYENDNLRQEYLNIARINNIEVL